MYNFTNYDNVFPPDTTYDAAQVQGIEKRRRELEGLFVDKILKLLGIKRRKSTVALILTGTYVLYVAARHYPPKTNDDLRQFHETVVRGDQADHYKLSLLYYVLLDCEGSSTMRREDSAEAFAEKCHIPTKYQIYMQGLWHMDRLQFDVSANVRRTFLISHIRHHKVCSQLETGRFAILDAPFTYTDIRRRDNGGVDSSGEG